MSKQAIPTSRAIRFLFSYMKRYRFSIAIGIALLIVVDIIQLVIPRIIKTIIDALGNQIFSRDVVLKNVVMIAGLALGMTIIRFCYRMLIFFPSRKIETGIRNDLFAHISGLSFSFFNATKTGDLLALFTNDLNAVRMATGMALIGMTDAFFLGTLSFVFMLTINVKLTLLAISPLPLIIIVMLRFGGLIQSRFTGVQESFGAMSSHAQEALSGIRVVKGFLQEKSQMDEFSRRCDDYVDKNIRLVRLWGALFPLIGFFGAFSFGLLYLIGGRQAILGELSLGTFVSFMSYIQLFIWPIMAIGWVYNILQRGIASTKRLLELMETTAEVRVAAASQIAPIKGKITFRNLSLSSFKSTFLVVSGWPCHNFQ